MTSAGGRPRGSRRPAGGACGRRSRPSRGRSARARRRRSPGRSRRRRPWSPQYACFDDLQEAVGAAEAARADGDVAAVRRAALDGAVVDLGDRLERGDASASSVRRAVSPPVRTRSLRGAAATRTRDLVRCPADHLDAAEPLHLLVGGPGADADQQRDVARRGSGSGVGAEPAAERRREAGRADEGGVRRRGGDDRVEVLVGLGVEQVRAALAAGRRGRAGRRRARSGPRPAARARRSPRRSAPRSRPARSRAAASRSS